MMKDMRSGKHDFELTDEKTVYDFSSVCTIILVLHNMVIVGVKRK